MTLLAFVQKLKAFASDRRTHKKERESARAATRLAEPAFAKVWDNDENSDYDRRADSWLS